MSERPNLPSTSKDAYKKVSPDMLNSHHGKIISCLKKIKKGNYEKIAANTRLDKHAVGRRLSELERMGTVYKPGTKSPTSTGRDAFDYKLTNPDEVVIPMEGFKKGDKKSSDHAKEILKQSALFKTLNTIFPQ